MCPDLGKHSVWDIFVKIEFNIQFVFDKLHMYVYCKDNYINVYMYLPV